MNVVLYMAMSANGYIAQPDNKTPWSVEEFASYNDMVQKVGNLIIGKTTFDLMTADNSLADLNEVFVAVLTSSTEKPSRENTVFVKNFREALEILEKQGFETALVGGGSQTNTAALNSGLVNELYIDIEPLVFGRGIPPFAQNDTNLTLTLLGTKEIGTSGIQLHYKMEK